MSILDSIASVFGTRYTEASTHQTSTGKRCPVCNREYWYLKEHRCCRWCGAAFNNAGALLLNVKYRPGDYPAFRNVWDVNNIIPYSTLHLKENQMFLSYLFNNFRDCKLENKIYANQLFPNAPDYSMPINFLLTKGNKKVAVLLVEGDAKYKRYSVLETMELCKENNITALRFITTYPNEEKYVVERIRKAIEQ